MNFGLRTPARAPLLLPISMYLREVIISGFKSFADTTRLKLDPGVTAIVGPNGCGKSNISDAIRWVLGEQSAKSLRGNKMQDIIFGGTDRRKALPFCQVTLAFADCERELGSSFHEVEVSRRVSRDGSSHYAINGKTARLKDLQRLFMDTGVGRVAYSFLVQGQVDQILSSNPNDRRTIFEEAAGITKYKSQRREALNKLALVDANLARVTDVIEEINRQIGSLKRQAGKALRYKRLHHRQSNLELALSAFRLRGLRSDITAREQEKEALSRQAAEVRARLASGEASLEGDRNARAEALAAVEHNRESLFEARSGFEAAEAALRLLTTRRKEWEEQVERLARECEQLRQQIKTLSEEEQREAENRTVQLGLLGNVDDSAQQREAHLAESESRLQEQETALRQAKEKVFNLETRIARLRSTCTSREVELQSSHIRHASLAEAIQLLHEEAEKLGQRLGQTQAALSERETTLEAVNREAQTLSENLTATRTRFREKQVEIQESDRELARANARLQTLRDLQARMEGFGEGSKGILQGKLGDNFPKEEFVLLSNLLRVEETYTGAVESLLGPAIDALVYHEGREVGELLAALNQRKLGKTALLIQSRAAQSTATTAPEGLIAAASVVSCAEEKLTGLINGLFAGCYIADTDARALAAMSQGSDFTFSAIATLEGSIFKPEGIVLTGQQVAAEKSLLGRVSEIRKIGQNIRKMETAVEDLREEAGKIQLEIDSIEARTEENRQQKETLSGEISTMRAELRSLTATQTENAANLERNQRRMEEMEAGRRQTEETLATSQQELKTAEEEFTALRQTIAEGEKALEDLRQVREERREAWTRARLEQAQNRQQLELLEKGIGEIARRLADARFALTGRERETSECREKIAQSAEEMTSLREQCTAAQEQIGNRQQALENARSTLQEIENRLTRAEEGLSADREQERSTSQTLSQIEVDLTRLRSRLDFINEKILTEHSVDINTVDYRRALWDAERDFGRVKLDEVEEGEALDFDTVDKRGEPTPELLERQEEPNWDSVEKEVADLREKITSMGPVNLVAIEEYRELRERHHFLKSQSDDLWNSKEELVKAIDEINATSQSLFQETFEAVRKNFQYTYEHLTGGGKSDLSLIAAEDPLDSGIEIRAQPPGVRHTSLSLLSGGQRTMAAVALLFAIYMVKPSPFCVLDELDAPLDDANIGRFTEMLRRFTEFSQFLIITHNKRTIATADSVFGVTMQEKGVSRLLSMRFNHRKGEAEHVVEEVAAVE